MVEYSLIRGSRSSRGGRGCLILIVAAHITGNPHVRFDERGSGNGPHGSRTEHRSESDGHRTGPYPAPRHPPTLLPFLPR